MYYRFSLKRFGEIKVELLDLNKSLVKYLKSDDYLSLSADEAEWLWKCIRLQIPVTNWSATNYLFLENMPFLGRILFHSALYEKEEFRELFGDKSLPIAKSILKLDPVHFLKIIDVMVSAKSLSYRQALDLVEDNSELFLQEDGHHEFIQTIYQLHLKRPFSDKNKIPKSIEDITHKLFSEPHSDFSPDDHINNVQYFLREFSALPSNVISNIGTILKYKKNV